MDKIPETQVIKVKTDKWAHINIRSFCTTKEMLNKRRLSIQETRCINYASDKGLMCRTYNMLKKLNKNTNNPVNNGQRGINGHSSKDKPQMARRHMK